ncbi:hypothetical protein J1605_000230 [Eschrichtius robustus]|uniref:Uncharacterized protein n=1 Tax=Eschrichtius robustus TaxID=9764 RepID=A0AB34HQW7_ESCRO|nr:hypothetical protein J1605_000230 [Eschrichtius robustus]
MSAPRRQPAVPAHAGRHRLRAWLAGALSSPAVRAAPWSSAERGSQGRRRLEEPDAAAGIAAGAAGAMTVEQNVLQQSAAQKVRRSREPARPGPAPPSDVPPSPASAGTSPASPAAARASSAPGLPLACPPPLPALGASRPVPGCLWKAGCS